MCGIGLLVDLKNRPGHALVEQALAALARLEHRGGGGATPDGAGILTEIPWTLVEADIPQASARPESRAIGMFFVSPAAAAHVQSDVDRVLRRFHWDVVGWRPVPVAPEALSVGDAPDIWQAVLVDRGGERDADARLYRARVELDGQFQPPAAVVSLSRRTVVYKGLLKPDRLASFYDDLRDPRFVSRLAIVHERFSTNTFPRWDLAQPFHVLAHNGEINTIAGNRLWMAARRRAVRTTGSDSQSLDDAVDAWRESGCSLLEALARVIPPAWEHDPRLSRDEHAFFRYQACHSEPWDGPAAVAFSDGRLAGALLDRNGLRPARYLETSDGRFLLGSEAGIFDVPESAVCRRGRLGPGETIVVDVESGRVRRPADVRRSLAREHPYKEWMSRFVLPVPASLPSVATDVRSSGDSLTRRQKLFGYTSEELTLILTPMAQDGKEPIGSMGDDTPIASLSRRSRLFSDFFRQRFAQVTNPPIDPQRERAVMSLEILVGPATSTRPGEPPSTHPHYRRWLALPSPVLTEAQFTSLSLMPGFRAAVIPLFFRANGRGDLEHRLDAIADTARRHVETGAALIILSDSGATESTLPIPPQLAIAAIHHHLIAAGVRSGTTLIVDTSAARDAHQVATLLAFGATAVFPSLAYETVAALAAERGGDCSEWVMRFRTALDDGLLKIFSKMGIATASGYIGAQLFEILGLDHAVAGRYFPGVPCGLGGFTLDDLAREAIERHASAFADETPRLEHAGLHGYRRDGEYHANNPALVRELHRAARSDSEEAYEHFTRLAYERPVTTVRDLLTFRAATAIPLERVEPVGAICRRFFASAMSVGALSPEAHRTIAVALNLLGARSNSGEGGEESDRWTPRPGEPSSNSATKQVASARFGVTAAYLTSASELQIKIGQGAKPGEGGQLPAIKAVAHIARLRHAQPGITLISPPPHHDIYSIEDLAQLIHDLREVNPQARINVKLVAQAGVGIVAAGVAKAGADAILISGHDGGTGASPRGSIKHAGSPWELGLIEAQEVLTRSGLRDRVILQTDGGLKTGRDLVLAAALGAEEFGFGTAVLVAIGCVMARQCHLNTCPAGIATQRSDLRLRFAGTPEMVVAYFRLLAAEVRRILAELGFETVGDLVGRADLLTADRCGTKFQLRLARTTLEQRLEKTKLKLRPTSDLNARIVADVSPSLGVRPVRHRYAIRNTDRAVGARLAGEIARRYGDAGSPSPVHLEFHGTAGQSFGAFLLPGMRLELSGEANDYLAKGMHGGEVVIRNDEGAAGVLAGNTALYGATGGAVFIAGSAGERFAVRNSGAIAVVEGVGDHGCEYMTGGLVVVLGAAGRNFAAGMTGGRAYVWDPDAQLDHLCNRELVHTCALSRHDIGELRTLIAAHRELTKSRLAGAILERWSESLRAFRAVVPIDSPANVPRHHTITPRAPAPRASAANASLIPASG